MQVLGRLVPSIHTLLGPGLQQTPHAGVQAKNLPLTHSLLDIELYPVGGAPFPG